MDKTNILRLKRVQLCLVNLPPPTRLDPCVEKPDEQVFIRCLSTLHPKPKSNKKIHAEEVGTAHTVKTAFNYIHHRTVVTYTHELQHITPTYPTELKIVCTHASKLSWGIPLPAPRPVPVRQVEPYISGTWTKSNSITHPAPHPENQHTSVKNPSPSKHVFLCLRLTTPHHQLSFAYPPTPNYI